MCCNIAAPTAFVLRHAKVFFPFFLIRLILTSFIPSSSFLSFFPCCRLLSTFLLPVFRSSSFSPSYSYSYSHSLLATVWKIETAQDILMGLALSVVVLDFQIQQSLRQDAVKQQLRTKYRELNYVRTFVHHFVNLLPYSLSRDEQAHGPRSFVIKAVVGMHVRTR